MKFPVLTYTILNNFLTCPHRAFRQYIAKDIPFEKTPEMEHGTRVHKALEDRIGKGIALDADLRSADPLCQRLDDLAPEAKTRVEYFTGMKIDGTGCTWDAKDVWFRGKADVAVMVGSAAWLIDWKTGKVREEPFELECQAMLVHANHPQITHIVGEYYWMREGKPGMRYTLDPMVTYQKVTKLYGAMVDYYTHEVANDPPGIHWPKRKNPLCSWCDVKGCENWKPRP